MLVATGREARPVIPMVADVATNPRDSVRIDAIEALGDLGIRDSSALAALIAATRDPVASVRLTAADALAMLGETAPARAAFRQALHEDVPATRLWAAHSLARLSDPAAVPVLRAALRDSAFGRWSRAAVSIGVLGPKAAAALPELFEMVRDTALRRVPQGQTATVSESRAAYAAWALTKVLPFRTSGGGGTVIDPMIAVIDSGALRDDGHGPYVWGADSVAVFQGSGLFLQLSPSVLEARGPIGRTPGGLRRSIAFDLGRPVAGSGAAARGLVRDPEAYIWVWHRRDPATGHVRTTRELDVDDSTSHVAERVEMHFRIDGVLHVLQMGPFVEGGGGSAIWRTGMHGNGTSTARIRRPARDVWIVEAGAEDRARLWSFENRSVPVDRGLYHFPLRLRFVALPGGAGGACVPMPATCEGLREPSP